MHVSGPAVDKIQIENRLFWSHLNFFIQVETEFFKKASGSQVGGIQD